MKRTLQIILFALLLCFCLLQSSCKAQQQSLWSWADAVLVGGLTADEIGTHIALSNGAREAGVFRNTTVRCVVKGGCFGLVKWYDAEPPQSRKWTRIIEAGIGGA